MSGDVLAQTTIEATVLQAVQGDLTQEDVDAIVNAANVHLRHGGGVAGAISRTAGPVVQEASDAWVQEHGPLDVGQAAVTPAGKLPAHRVIHVAGPVYEQGSDDNEPHLRAAVRGALAAARDHDLRTVSIPAISAGIYGYPPQDATRIIVDEAAAVIRGLRDGLDAVRFVGVDRETAQLFADGIASLS